MHWVEWGCDRNPRRRYLKVGRQHPVIGEHELAGTAGIVAQIVVNDEGDLAS